MAKKSSVTKTLISRRMAAKIEEIIRIKELDMLLERRNLGLEPTGDMKDFVKDLVKKLKSAKAKNNDR
ncbi:MULTISPECIES: hypothetical protein [unclassified Microcoleus]|uniref:hypothetical protein n=1 Tax=unclassified Microcoleus TaxID=2642155 RepID=UPI002FCEC907